MKHQPEKTKKPMRVPVGALIFLSLFIFIKVTTFLINPKHYKVLLGGTVFQVIYIVCAFALLIFLCLRFINFGMAAVFGSLCACEICTAISYIRAAAVKAQFEFALHAIISVSLSLCYALFIIIVLKESFEKAVVLKVLGERIDVLFNVALVVYALANLIEIIYTGNQLEAFLLLAAILFIRMWISDPWKDEEDFCIGLVSLFFLWLFTFKIYPAIWVYNVTRYSNRTGEKKRSPIVCMLLVMFVPFYEWYWMYTMGSAVDALAGEKRLQSDITLACLLLDIFGLAIVSALFMQNKINQTVLRTDNDIAKLKEAEREFLLGEDT